MREQGDVWLGFEPAKLRGWLEAARTLLESWRVDGYTAKTLARSNS